MKKEFKAPIVETKELITRNGIMADDIAIFTLSADKKAREDSYEIVNSIESGYNAWKGFNN